MLFCFAGTSGVRFGSIEGCLHHDGRERLRHAARHLMSRIAGRQTYCPRQGRISFRELTEDHLRRAKCSGVNQTATRIAAAHIRPMCGAGALRLLP